MKGIKKFQISVRTHDFNPEYLSDTDVEVSIIDMMMLLPNLERLNAKIRHKDHIGGSIELMGVFFNAIMRFAPSTCGIYIDAIDLDEFPEHYEHLGLDDSGVVIYDRVLEVSETDAWPEFMRGWDGRDAVRLTGTDPRRMELKGESDYE